MGSDWLLHKLGAGGKREHAVGSPSAGVTQFFGFPERGKQRWIGLGVELCRDMDYLVLSITKHLDSPKGREGQPQDVTDLMYYIKCDEQLVASYHLR